MRLVERDLAVIQELTRWRFVLGRQIRLLCGFTSQRTCDRRLRVLVESGYIDRRHVLYGVPGMYSTTHKGKKLVGASVKPDKIKVDQIIHDIAVMDTVIYFHLKVGIALTSISTEKELHKSDGFGIRKHQPDFTFVHEDKIYCVEVELTLKAKERMLKILDDNFTAYDYQKWIVPNTQTKIKRILQNNFSAYPNIQILSLEEVTDYVKQRGVMKNGICETTGGEDDEQR